MIGILPLVAALVAQAGPGIQVETRLVYAGHPDAPHRLVAVYGRGGRARWLRSLEGSGPYVRDLEYRDGENVFVLRAGEPASRRLEGDEALAVVLRFELRRALFAWPAGFEWSTAEEVPRVRVADVLLAPNGSPVGRLRAVLDDQGRPGEISVLHEGGGAGERLLVDAWSEDDEGSLPAALRLFLGETLVWSEEVLSLARHVEYLDVFFTPPDRRERAPRGPVPLDLVAVTFRRHAFAAPRGLDTALAEVDDLLVEAAEELGPDGPALDPVPTLEVDREGRFVAAQIRLQEAAEDPPAGWTHRPEGPGLAVRGLEPEDLEPGALRRILEEAARGHALGEGSYVRASGREARSGFTLFLPLRSGGGG